MHGQTLVSDYDNQFCLLMFCSMKNNDWPSTPSGWNAWEAQYCDIGIHLSYQSVIETAGSHTGLALSEGAQDRWTMAQVVLNGAPGPALHYLSWDAAGPITYGWAVQSAAGSLLDHNGHGGGLVGYHIEKHWAVSEGGDLLADTVEWLVYDAAEDLVYDHIVDFYTPSVGAIWPCEYVATPPDPGAPPSGVTDPHDPTPATLEGIAAEVHRLELKLDAVVNRLAYLTDGLATQQTPTAGVFGQAEEIVTGDFQHVVINALQAMSNYNPVGYLEHEIASGVTGDWEDTTGYAGYRIHLTSIPAYTGRRVSSPTFYEVNSRADQLGWFAPHVSAGQLDYRITVWEDSIAWCPAPYCDGLVLHLAPGVVATVYGLTVQYRPVN